MRRVQSATPRVTMASVHSVGDNLAQSLARLPMIRPSWSWVFVLLLAAAGFAAAQMFTSYQYYVYDAEIVGNQRVPAEAIYTASDIDQKNILWVRPGQVAKQVEALPGIASAHVSVRLPNRVRIEVQEREPFLTWQKGEESTWLAADGSVIPSAGTGPTLTLVDSESAAGTADGCLRPEILAGLTVLQSQYPSLTQVSYGPREGLYFKAPEGWMVYLGDGTKMAERLALLKTESPVANRTARPKIVDLRVEGKAFLR